MNVAIDSKPLNKKIHSTYDYSGLQYLSIKYTPFYNCILQEEHSNNSSSYILEGSQAQDFGKSFVRLLSGNVLLKKLIFNKITEVKVKKNNLIFNYKDGFDSLNFNIPNFSILRKNKIKAKIHLVASPKENHEFFVKNKINFLSDTAVDLEKIDSSYKLKWTGLIGALNYSQAFTKRKDFHDIHQTLQTFKLSKYFQKYPYIDKPIPSEKIKPKKKSNKNITIAFDGFYPNSMIVSELKHFLSDFGFNVVTILDDYYEPFQKYDIKFTISRPLGASHSYYWLWCLNQTFDPEKRKIILLNILNNNKFNFDFMLKNNISTPLLKIMSIQKSNIQRDNPLLDIFGNIYELANI